MKNSIFRESQKAFERLIGLNRRYKYIFIALMGPFQRSYELDQYQRKLGDNKQRLTMKFIKNNVEIMVTSVYIRCDALER
ncbi:hypothetical protein H5410_036127 [Solanum commersonii]|uniref:Uncharacterized protein n=1 Tax=Solanum commersonii TaxID=4109 RepID=A0A9J5Y4R5_SOLCO|nr:hypothetical protein H5410_036127 [Solanum commersonii]